MTFTREDFAADPKLVTALAALDASDANLLFALREYPRIVRTPKAWVLEALQAEARRRGLTL